MTASAAQLLDLSSWSHRLSAEVLGPGDLAVDLTAGRGHDCLHLARCVASDRCGTMLAFDIQEEAIASSLALLHAAGLPAERICRPQQIGPHGNFLAALSHERLELFLPRQPKVVLANLGYLPGGDHRTATGTASSLRAAQDALAALLPGGRLLLVSYTGHPGGLEEYQNLQHHLATLPPRNWQVLELRPLGRSNAPVLLVAEKRSPRL